MFSCGYVCPVCEGNGFVYNFKECDWCNKNKTYITIYHNNRCSKSRETLNIINGKNLEIKTIDYIINPPSIQEIEDILKKLNIDAEKLVRKNENLYKEKYASKKYSNNEWIKILSKNPILIERPIVINGEKAIIGRPPENVLTIL
jgi:arsenate reductase